MPGTDIINVELLQAAGPQMTQRIQELFLNTWRYEKKKMLNEWNKSIICPIHKSVEKFECSNYRGNSLLNNAYKILGTATNNRFKTHAEVLLSQEQNGFRRNRTTTDNTF